MSQPALRCEYVRAKGCHFVIEQPNSSVLWWYGPVEDLRKHLEN